MFKRFWVLYKRELVEFYLNRRGIIWLSVLFILLKVPSLFEPYWYGDEGVTMTVGMAIRKGLLLYRDIYDNKPPVLYLIAAIANGNLFLFKLTSLLLGLTGVWFFFQLSKFVFSEKKPLITGVINLVFIFLVTTPIFEGNIVNGEIIFLVFSLAGWYFTLVQNRYWASGLFFSLAFLTKVPAFFDLVPLIVMMAAHYGKKSSPSYSLTNIIRLSIAFVLPVFVSLLFFTIRGGLVEYVQTVFFQMAGYVSSWGLNTHSMTIKGVALILIGLLFWFQWQKKKTIPFGQLFVFWLISALFGATMSQRPYPHYLLQAVAPLCFCFGFLIISKPTTKVLMFLSLCLFFFAFKYYHFWQYPNLSYQKNFVTLLLRGSTTKASYYRFFDQSLPEIYRVAELIKVYTKADDKIFVWSNYAQLYPMTQRLPALRYTTAYHFTEKVPDSTNFLEENLSDIKLIAVDRRIEPNLNLNQIVSHKYFLVERLENYDIYIIQGDRIRRE